MKDMIERTEGQATEKTNDSVLFHFNSEEMVESFARLKDMKEFLQGETEESAKEIEKAVTVAIKALIWTWCKIFGEGTEFAPWRQTFEDDPDTFPDDDRPVLCSFSNCSGSIIGRWEEGDDGGGAWYVGDIDETFLEHGIFVDGWWELPKKPEAE